MSKRTRLAAHQAKPGLCADQRGTILIEYVVVAVMGATVAMALVSLGVAMASAFDASMDILYSEYP